MAKTQDPLAIQPALETPATQADLERWYIVAEQVATLKLEEMELRKRIFGTYFQNPVEGVNTLPLDRGYVMKGTYKIDRKVIEEALNICMQDFKDAKLPIKDLFVYKPTLSVSTYKKLSEEQQLLVDRALEIKPGAPALEITKPKR